VPAGVAHTIGARVGKQRAHYHDARNAPDVPVLVSLPACYREGCGVGTTRWVRVMDPVLRIWRDRPECFGCADGIYWRAR
jgi:hypothetical protein